MIALGNLAWTSRQALCEQLAAFLEATVPDVPDCLPPELPTQRQTAGELLVLLAEGPCTPFLLPFLRRRDEDRWLQLLALIAILRAELLLSPADYEAFLATEWADTSAACYLCRTPELVALALRWFGTLEPTRRARILIQLPSRSPWAYGWPRWGKGRAPVAEAVEALYRLWSDEDRFLPELQVREEDGSSLNLDVAAAMAGRPEAQDVLAEHIVAGQGWRGVPVHAMKRWHPEDMRYLFAAGVPPLGEFPFDLLRGAASASLMSLLRDHYGTDELFLLVESRLQDRSTASELHDVWTLLRTLPGPETDDFLVSLSGCPDRPRWLQRQLRKLTWERWLPRDRERAAEQLKQVFADPKLGEREVWSIAYRLACSPSPADRAFFWWAAQQEASPNLPFAGIVGLEALGEDSAEWQAQLELLTEHPFNAVHLLACAALIRRGKAEYLEPLEDAARKFSAPPWDRFDDHCQGLALRLLGELDAPRYAGLMTVVISQRLPYDYNGSPEQEAAFVLAQLATPEAVTTLLRAYVSGPDYLRRALVEYLPAAVARLEGREMSVANRIPVWRYSRIPP